ncbi:MAG: alpha/beta fold hydrolase, partial [Gammaproteobacteria bacterium]
MDTLLRLLLYLGTAYAVLTLMAYLLQDALIFYPSKLWRTPAGAHVQTVALDRADVTLHGWAVNPDADGPVLVYFGGNAEELSYLVDVFARLSATTLLINYRGYGLSEGKPSAAALIDDAHAVVEDLTDRFGAGRPLLLVGRSLGSGIAASVAASRPVDGLVMISPFRSLHDLAARVMPWLPTRWLLRHRIDVAATLGSLPENTLVLYSPQDQIVP